jgi:aminoglycoside/choline kinase family phosphotransferase
MLQRHLRLAGQFKLLSEKLGKPIYKEWVPGSLKRVGIALKKLPYLNDLAELLVTIPEIKCGYDEEN